MNTFEDMEHALLTGVVLATLRSKGLKADAILNDVEDTTPYLHVNLDGTEAIIVVMPPG